ncbi:MAG: hypothetical protein HY815_06280 [Candidatus Riflebacteria bacterium]|nr:hypothetical protein [Candidatus Riflebacteria bacterium]
MVDKSQGPSPRRRRRASRPRKTRAGATPGRRGARASRPPEPRSIEGELDRLGLEHPDDGLTPGQLEGPAPASEPLSDLARQFQDLWDRFQKLRGAPGGGSRVLSRVDPAVFIVRQKVLANCLKGLFLKSPRIRALPMEHKKVLARRLSNAVWKGYLLALAHQEIVSPEARDHGLVDSSYLWSTFSRLMDGRTEPEGSLDGLPQAVVRALAEIQSLESVRLEDEMGSSGAGSIVGPAGESKLLTAALGGLILMGFMIWLAQRRALGVDG